MFATLENFHPRIAKLADSPNADLRFARLIKERSHENRAHQVHFLSVAG
jgi:hypothetical protein